MKFDPWKFCENVKLLSNVWIYYNSRLECGTQTIILLGGLTFWSKFNLFWLCLLSIFSPTLATILQRNHIAASAKKDFCHTDLSFPLLFFLQANFRCEKWKEILVRFKDNILIYMEWPICNIDGAEDERAICELWTFVFKPIFWTAPPLVIELDWQVIVPALHATDYKYANMELDFLFPSSSQATFSESYHWAIVHLVG